MPETAILSDPKGRLRIEYSRPAMQQIRARAIDGLLALPRIGMGVGGLLLGARRDGVVSLANSIEIPCSHAHGPSFDLTDAEKQHAAALIAGAKESGVIGWYCSKTRGAPVLDDSVIAIFRDLFPGAEHLALLMRPSTIVPVRAVFCLRDKEGRIVRGIECDLDEWNPPVVAEVPVKVAIEEEKSNSIIDVPIAVPELRVPEPSPPTPPVPEIAWPPPPQFLSDQTLLPSHKTKAKLSGWMLAAAACVALAALSWFTRNIWHPVPPLALTVTQSNGKLMIRWNTDAFQGTDDASLTINDGGNLKTLSLDRVELNQGLYVHQPQSQRVTARMSRGDTSAIAVWFAPPPTEPPPAQPAATAPQKSLPPSPAHPPVPDDR